jgi:transposase-like protein
MARRLRRERVRRSAAYWARAVRRWQRSGLSVAAFCQQEGLPASSFRYWQHKVSSEGAERDPGEATMVPVEVVTSVSPAMDRSVFEVLLRSGDVLRVPSGFDPEALRVLVAVLEDRSC